MKAVFSECLNLNVRIFIFTNAGLFAKFAKNKVSRMKEWVWWYVLTHTSPLNAVGERFKSIKEASEVVEWQCNVDVMVRINTQICGAANIISQVIATHSVWVIFVLPHVSAGCHPLQITFKTKIYHPNVDEKGQVCLPIIIAENWKPATKTEQGWCVCTCTRVCSCAHSHTLMLARTCACVHMYIQRTLAPHYTCTYTHTTHAHADEVGLTGEDGVLVSCYDACLSVCLTGNCSFSSRQMGSVQGRNTR